MANHADLTAKDKEGLLPIDYFSHYDYKKTSAIIKLVTGNHETMVTSTVREEYFKPEHTSVLQSLLTPKKTSEVQSPQETKTTLAVSSLTHTVMFAPATKESSVAIFKREMADALAKYPEKDRLGRITNINISLGKLNNTSKDADVQKCLNEINVELKRTTRTARESTTLRKLLNPILLTMLNQLSIPIAPDLSQDLNKYAFK